MLAVVSGLMSHLAPTGAENRSLTVDFRLLVWISQMERKLLGPRLWTICNEENAAIAAWTRSALSRARAKASEKRLGSCSFAVWMF